MKKYSWLLCGLLLCACSSKPDATHKNTTKKIPSAPSEVVLKDASLVNTQGDGNEDGFYHFKTRETDDGNTITNITYYDYATHQELYLCDKPECRHTDDTCTSYIDIIPYTGVLFTHGNGLYVISNEAIENVSDAPCIIRMDLDGKNRKKLVSLDDGYRFDDNSFAISGSTLYHGVTKESLIDAGSYSLYTLTDQQLYAIDLESGDIKKECSMHDKILIGAEGNTLLFAHYNYEKDPDELLKNKDFEAYDEVTRNAKMGYLPYDIMTHKEGKEVISDSIMLATCSGDKLYYVTDHMYNVDMDTGKTSIAAKLPSEYSYALQHIIGDTAILEEWTKGDSAKFIQCYAVSLKDGKTKPLPLNLENPDAPVRILGFTDDQLLLLYNRDGHMEKSWAGTDQFQVDHEYIGRIKIEDYLAGKEEVLDIQTLE